MGICYEIVLGTDVRDKLDCLSIDFLSVTVNFE